MKGFKSQSYGTERAREQVDKTNAEDAEDCEARHNSTAY